VNVPEFLKKKLKAQAEEKGYSGDRADKYVYGTMNKMGAMHGSEETAKGRAMQKKHEGKKGWAGRASEMKNGE